MDKTRYAVPQEARELNAVLSNRNYSRIHPRRFRKEFRVTLIIDEPGLLDFYEPTVREVWPEGDTIAIRAEDGTVSKIENRYTDYENGFYSDNYWNINNLIKSLN